jgi:Ca2+-binding RTX toxin-like protein
MDLEWSDGSKVSLESLLGTATAQIHGTALADTITSASGVWKETVYGYEGDDVINTDGGDDVVYGNEGNDIIAGGNGSDLIIGGPGNDQLAGEKFSTNINYSNNDVYEFSTGDGQDAVVHYTHRNEHRGTLRLNNAADSKEISLVKNGQHLQVHYGDQGDYVEVQNFHSHHYYQFLDIQWSNGQKTALTTLWSQQQTQ